MGQLDPYLTKDEVARLLKVSRRTVDRLVARGELRAVKLGRLVRFRLEDIEALGQAPEPEPPSTPATD